MAIAVNLVSGVVAVATERLVIETEVTWTMVDVTGPMAQGDAHLLEIGSRVVLIDAGSYVLGRSRLVSYLEAQGIDRLDWVFVSHAHEDHFGGIRALIEADIDIGQVEISLPDAEVCRTEIPWGCNENDIRKLLALLHGEQIPVEEPVAPRAWHFGPATFELVQRLDTFADYAGAIDVNDTSMVLRLDVADGSVLFTGDLNTISGEHLMRRELGLRSTVLLKVPHHGTESLPRDEFFAAIDPDIAFVPAGSELWRSERSSRPRSWLESRAVPTFVSGDVGHVTVHLGEHLQIETERGTRQS
ncbi:MAG: MBL fold metallo-hydrolase [Actinomycetota bacterium]|nr:MBL fold metallo-hydrolase [Actinomycetota bacterium]